MGTINKKREPKVQAEKHLNFMGGAGYFLNDRVRQLEMAASSCFFGEPQYYHRDKDDKRPVREHNPHSLSASDVTKLREQLNAIDPQEWRGLTPKAMMVRAIDAALDCDPVRTLALACKLRTQDHIRTTPQVILVRAAHHKAVKGTNLIRLCGQDILQRPDEAAVQLAYHLETYGKDTPIPNSLKRLWRKKLTFLTEYELAKYKLEGRGVKLVDVVNLVHPKSEEVGKLVRGELKNTETWEAIISSKGSTRKTWEEALEHMGHMALLRNIRNLHEHDVPYKTFLKKLVDGAKYGKQLPFRYYSAFKALGETPGPIQDAIETCMEVALGDLPRFEGKAMFLCDNSGSAWGATTSSMGTMHIAEIANLTAVLGAHLADEGYVGVFGDELEVLPIRKKGSIFEQLKEVTDKGHGIGGGTENGIWLFWDKAIRNKEHWDNVFVFSDMQAGHGGLYGLDPRQYRGYAWNAHTDHAHIDVGKLINAYRARVNPNVNVYLVQVAGYQDIILPEFYKRTYILSGWSEGLFKFAHQMSNMMEQEQAQQK